MFFSNFFLGIIFVLSLLVYVNPSYSLTENFFYSPDSEINGLTYDDWAIKYWQWQLNFPNSIQPTEEKCVIGNESSVLFLGNPIFAFYLEDNIFTPENEGVLEYECTIPSNKPIFVHGSVRNLQKRNCIRKET